MSPADTFSPWTDVKQSAQELKDKYIFSYKPSPAALAVFKIDKETIRKDLVRVMEETKGHGCILEVIMKDTHTVKINPNGYKGGSSLPRKPETKSAIDIAFKEL